MRLRLPLFGLALLAGCAGRPLASTQTGTSPLPAPDVYGCLRDRLKTVGFTQTSYDVDEMRLSARRYDETVRRPDVQFRRLVDRITFEVTPGSEGVVTAISGDAMTFAEYSTHRGPTEEQEKTSGGAQQAVRQLIDACSSPVDSLPRQG